MTRMSKIDVSQWKEFNIGKLFDFYRGKEAAPNRVPDGDIPFISETRANNGVVKLASSEHVFPGKSITVSVNYASTVLYQEKDFCASVNIIVLHNDKLTVNVGLFLAAVISKLHQKYSYNDKVSAFKLKQENIKLPVTSSGEPDWQYMDSYIAKRAALAHKYVSELKSTKNQRKPLKVSGWQEYKISQLFNIRPSKYIRGNGTAFSNRKLFDDGPNPVVVNSSGNNGIGGTTSYEPTEHGNVITYSDTVDGNTIFYQAKPFVGYSHVKVMEPKEKLDPAEMVFLTAVIGRRLSDGNYDYTNKMTTNRVLNTTIKLPALSDGTPDWATMRKRVAHLAALSHRNVTSLRLVTGM